MRCNNRHWGQPKYCEADVPWSTRAWDAIEERAESQPAIGAEAVKVVEWADIFEDDAEACAQTLLGRDSWHEPFVIRAAVNLPLTAERLLKAGARLGNVSAFDMRRYSEKWSRVAQCPHERFAFSRQVTAEAVLANQEAEGGGAPPPAHDLYTSFSSETLQRIRKAYVSPNHTMLT